MKFDKKVFNLVVPKKLALALLAGTVSLTAFADNKLKVQDIQILSGQTAVVSVYMENDENITTMQARVNLPEGLTLVASGKDEYEDDIYYILNQSRTYDPNDPDAQSKQRHEINFGALYQEPGADGSLVQITHPKNAPFVGTQGEIFYLTVKATDALADLSEITLTDAHFGTTSAQDIVPEVENGKVTKLAEPAGIGILTADDFIINPDGTEYELVLSLQNNYDLKALQFDLHLPKGLVIVPGKEGASTNAEGRMTNSRLNGDANEIEDGVWRITYSNPQSSPKIKLAAGEGPIIGIIVKATHELEKSAQIVIDNVTLTRPNLKEIEPEALVINLSNPNAAAMETAQLLLDDALAQLEAAKASISEELRPVAAARALLRDEAVTTGKADVAAAWTAAQEAYDALKQLIEDAYQAGTLADADYQALYDASIAADEALTAAGVQADALVAEYEYLDTQWAAYDKAVATVREGLKDNEKIKAAEKAATDAIKVLKTRIDDFYAEKKLAGADLAVQKQDVEDAIFNIVLCMAKAEAQERIDAANALAIDPETKAYQDDEVQAKVAQAETAIANAQQAANNLNTLIDNLGENLNTPQGQGQLGQALYQTDMTIAAAKGAIAQADAAKVAAIAEAEAVAAAKAKAQEAIDAANALAIDPETEAYDDETVQQKVEQAKQAIETAKAAAENVNTVIDAQAAMNSPQGQGALNQALGQAAMALQAAKGAIQAADAAKAAAEQAKIEANAAAYAALNEAIDNLRKQLNDTKAAINAEDEDVARSFDLRANEIEDAINAAKRDLDARREAVELNAESTLNPADLAEQIAQLKKDADEAQAEFEATAMAEVAVALADGLKISDEARNWPDENLQAEIALADQDIADAKAAAKAVEDLIAANKGNINSDEFDAKMEEALEEAAAAYDKALESINGVEQGYQNLKKDADEQAAAQAAIAEAAADKAAADALVAPADVEGDEALQAYIDAAKEAVKAAKDGANALSEQVAADTEDGRLSDEQAAAFDAADQAVDEAIAAAEAAIAAAEDAIEAADAAAYERLKDKLNKLDGALGAAKSAIETGCPDVAAEYTDAAQAIEDQINALKTDLENKHADKALNAGSDYDTAAIEAAIEKMKKDAVDAQKTFNDNKEAKTYWDGVLAGLGTRLDQDKAAIAEDGLTSQFADDVDAIEKQIEDLKKAIDGAFEDRLLTNDSFNKEMEAIQALLAALEANHNVAVGITAAVLMKEKNAQFFTLSGKRIEVPMKGQMVIVKYADGKTKKVLVK